MAPRSTGRTYKWFPGPKLGRYFGSLPCDPQGEAELRLGTVRASTLAVPKSTRTRSEPEPYQDLGGCGGEPPEPAEPRRVAVPPSAAIPHRDR